MIALSREFPSITLARLQDESRYKVSSSDPQQSLGVLEIIAPLAEGGIGTSFRYPNLQSKHR